MLLADCAKCGRAFLPDLHFHVVSCDSDSEASYSLPRRWFKNCSGLHVESGTVPGADHFIAFDLAFCQRSAAMRTGILNRVVSATHIENVDLLPTYLDELSPF